MYSGVSWGPDHESDNRFAGKNFFDLENVIFYNIPPYCLNKFASKSTTQHTQCGAIWHEYVTDHGEFEYGNGFGIYHNRQNFLCWGLKKIQR